MKLLHTSDWHLGHSLRDIDREPEHRAFLQWLLATLQTEQPDALLITGDVFDSATPPASAEQLWYQFLADAAAVCPQMRTVVIAGNHDSPMRLSAPSPIVARANVTIVSGIPRRPDGSAAWAQLLVPFANDRGLIAAVPYLRPYDIALVPPHGDRPAVRQVYDAVGAAAQAALRPGQALIVLGHLYAAGGVAAPTSERPIAIGGQEAATPSMFPKTASYVALGHLHRPQKVLAPTVRYAGAPIPLAIEEAEYRHSVVVVDLDDETLVATPRLLEVPRLVPMMRVPRTGTLSLPDALSALADLGARIAPLGDAGGVHAVTSTTAPLAAINLRPFVELHVELAAPEPKLRTLIEKAADAASVRLLGTKVHYRGDASATLTTPEPSLAELNPRDVFLRLWQRKYGATPPVEVEAAFTELLMHAQGSGAL